MEKSRSSFAVCTPPLLALTVVYFYRIYTVQYQRKCTHTQISGRKISDSPPSSSRVFPRLNTHLRRAHPRSLARTLLRLFVCPFVPSVGPGVSGCLYSDRFLQSFTECTIINNTLHPTNQCSTADNCILLHDYRGSRIHLSPRTCTLQQQTILWISCRYVDITLRAQDVLSTTELSIN